MRNRLNTLLALVAVRLEKRMRPYIKRAIYKRLYGGRATLRERLAVRLYKHLPDAHPIALMTLEGR